MRAVGIVEKWDAEELEASGQVAAWLAWWVCSLSNYVIRGVGMKPLCCWRKWLENMTGELSLAVCAAINTGKKAKWHHLTVRPVPRRSALKGLWMFAAMHHEKLTSHSSTSSCQLNCCSETPKHQLHPQLISTSGITCHCQAHTLAWLQRLCVFQQPQP